MKPPRWWGFQCDVFVDKRRPSCPLRHVFAQVEGLLGLFDRVLSGRRQRKCTYQIDVGDVIKFAVPGTFVVYGAGLGSVRGFGGTWTEYFAAVCFVTERPDYYGGWLWSRRIMDSTRQRRRLPIPCGSRGSWSRGWGCHRGAPGEFPGLLRHQGRYRHSSARRRSVNRWGSGWCG